MFSTQVDLHENLEMHPGDPGSSPGVGIFRIFSFSELVFVTCHKSFRSTQRGYGATVARLTPDQTVGRSNRSGLIFP